MTTKCPHCGKSIDYLGASELDKEFGIGANRLQHARDTGKFPDAWLQFGNRNIYLRSDVEAYIQNRAQEGAGKAVKALQRLLDTLPPEEAKRALAELTRPSKG